MMLGLEDPTSLAVLPDNTSNCVQMSNDVDVNNDSQRLLLQAVNNNYARSEVTVAELLQRAASNGGKNFNIFLNSTDSKVISRKDPRSTQAEIKNKIAHASKIANVRYTRAGSWIFSTADVDCAIDICNITEFLGVHANTRVIYENITNRFLVFNIPVGIFYQN